MADRNKQLKIEWQDGNPPPLSPAESVALITQLYDTLSPFDLAKMRDLAEKKRKERERAKVLLLAEFRERAEKLGMSLESILPRRRIRSDAGKRARVKYMSPDGVHSWAGRGGVPNWLKQLETEGHDREEFRVK